MINILKLNSQMTPGRYHTQNCELITRCKAVDRAQGIGKDYIDYIYIHLLFNLATCHLSFKIRSRTRL